jgi:hypothetical protein
MRQKPTGIQKRSAVARTVSLFTGRTDEESDRARDNSEPREAAAEQIPYQSRPRHWLPNSGIGGWICGEYTIEEVDGAYNLKNQYGLIGAFGTLIDALSQAEIDMKREQ